MALERALEEAQRKMSGFVRAEAGFHAELLPTWGGNAKDILDQPKCWSIANATGQSANVLDEDEVRERYAAGAVKRVEKRFEELRQDPGRHHALLQKIARVRREQRPTLAYGRSHVVENKWLCDDRETCIAHWRELADLRARIVNAESKRDKIQLLALWPSPPEENQSAERRLARISDRAAETADRIEDARRRRDELEIEREQELMYLTNRREVTADLKKRVERAMRLREALCKLVVMAKAGSALSSRLSATQMENIERRRMVLAAAAIQRRWKDTKASAVGAQYRNAVRVVRRFAVRSAAIRRRRKTEDAANMIYWFLTAYENANFQMVMRNYRYRVVNCQRYFRSETSLLSGVAAQLSEQASTRSTLCNTSAGALAAAMDLGMHVPRKVPKEIRRRIIKEHLEQLRAQFKEQWKKFCRSRNNVAAEARFVTVEDVRTAVQAVSPTELDSMLAKRGEDSEAEQRPPLFKVFSNTTEKVMLDLIERGRAIVEDQFLDVLSEEP
ncbi:Hypothetical Protein FCC1311_042462 [Hondaea fermentalgiana]|uniref:Uncharacterized protein n=1 Tax=Hondaea fermentalgiana TaxID=2315210 RepID=A0A2R5GHA0_9STRA|nr:Hypothetical Protein FCC1311_042462 [Hondaea fermentalgiana]|eukprot:GBG28023.1 Hypothetical Protein FCC1311_042462 [Hondaea fermentalgiana]